MRHYQSFSWKFLSVLGALYVLIWIQACSQRRVSRTPFPSPRITAPSGVEALPRKTVPLPDDSSMIAKIGPRTSPQRAASLRFTEEGKRLIESGKYARALIRLEKTISIDSTNPYAYFYLGKTHYHLGHFKDSLNFLDVAESLFSSKAYWLAEVFALKGENFRALGLFRKADSSYSNALKLNSGNRVAAKGLSDLRGKNTPYLR